MIIIIAISKPRCSSPRRRSIYEHYYYYYYYYYYYNYYYYYYYYYYCYTPAAELCHLYPCPCPSQFVEQVCITK